MNKPKERQQWIYEELIKCPLLTYGEMFTIYLQNFTNISRQTFTKDWNKAVEKHKEYQQAINKAKLEERIKLEKESVELDILTKNGGLVILTKIAEGKSKEVEGETIIPSYGEQIAAIKTISELEGWKAPIRTETKLEIKDDFTEDHQRRLEKLLEKATKLK